MSEGEVFPFVSLGGGEGVGEQLPLPLSPSPLLPHGPLPRPSTFLLPSPFRFSPDPSRLLFPPLLFPPPLFPRHLPLLFLPFSPRPFPRPPRAPSHERSLRVAQVTDRRGKTAGAGGGWRCRCCAWRCCSWQLPSQPNCSQYRLPGCPRHFNPVCGSDMSTYANECTLCMKIREGGHNIKIIRNGPC
eukprot:XP_011532707.1 serine protease inhibitor Kazal-type 2 isoform X2 [Homo sapiens]